MSADSVTLPIPAFACPAWCTDVHEFDGEGTVHRTDLYRGAWGKVWVNQDVVIEGTGVRVEEARVVIEEDDQGRGSADAAEARLVADALVKAAVLMDSIGKARV